MKGLLEYAKKTSPGRTRMDLQTRNLRSKVHPSKGHRRADAEPKLEEELEKEMEDFQIIDLYWKRDESAISETAKKYGAFCLGIAGNILSRKEDAEECVSDTYYQAWESIPPARPEKLRA